MLGAGPASARPQRNTEPDGGPATVTGLDFQGPAGEQRSLTHALDANRFAFDARRHAAPVIADRQVDPAVMAPKFDHAVGSLGVTQDICQCLLGNAIDDQLLL